MRFSDYGSWYIYKAGTTLTQLEASELESEVGFVSEDSQENHFKLLGYYNRKDSIKWTKHFLWIVANTPCDNALGLVGVPGEDLQHNEYNMIKECWLSQVRTTR